MSKYAILVPFPLCFPTDNSYFGSYFGTFIGFFRTREPQTLLSAVLEPLTSNLSLSHTHTLTGGRADREAASGAVHPAQRVRVGHAQHRRPARGE